VVIGECESGMAAALLGAMRAAVLVGIGTIVAALLWMRFFRRFETRRGWNSVVRLRCAKEKTEAFV
jgi:hypothetical protein